MKIIKSISPLLNEPLGGWFVHLGALIL